MIVAMATLAVGLLALPHGAGLWRRSAATALVLWSVALAVRAAGCLVLAVCLMVVVPSTAAFATLTDWCVDDVVPALAGHVGMLGHRVGDALSLAPFVALSGSALWVAVRIARGARTVRRLLSWSMIGPGPRGTVVLGGRQVMLGAAGFLRPRVVVSAGALAALDDEELAAAIAHEQGHIRRGHRFVAVFAELCGALGRPLPGTRRVVAEIHRQIERDADDWALARSHDRMALAGAICKCALSRGPAPAPALALLSGSGAADRVEDLLRGPPARRRAGDRDTERRGARRGGHAPRPGRRVGGGRLRRHPAAGGRRGAAARVPGLHPLTGRFEVLRAVGAPRPARPRVLRGPLAPLQSSVDAIRSATIDPIVWTRKAISSRFVSSR